jgi:hypothetical protein
MDALKFGPNSAAADEPNGLRWPGVSRSLHRFQVRRHHALHPEKAGIFENFSNSGDAPLPAKSQRFHRDIDTDAISELEAIGHGPCRGVDSDPDFVEGMGFYPFSEGEG